MNRAINVVSNDVARLPVVVVEKTDDGIEARPDHPVSALLRQPNGLECRFDWLRKMVRDLMLYGNAFSFISTNGLALWSLRRQASIPAGVDTINLVPHDRPKALEIP